MRSMITSIMSVCCALACCAGEIQQNDTHGALMVGQITYADGSRIEAGDLVALRVYKVFDDGAVIMALEPAPDIISNATAQAKNVNVVSVHWKDYLTATPTPMVTPTAYPTKKPKGGD